MIGTAHLMLLAVLGMVILIVTGMYIRPLFPVPGMLLIVTGFFFPMLPLLGLAGESLKD